MAYYWWKHLKSKLGKAKRPSLRSKWPTWRAKLLGSKLPTLRRVRKGCNDLSLPTVRVVNRSNCLQIGYRNSSHICQQFLYPTFLIMQHSRCWACAVQREKDQVLSQKPIPAENSKINRQHKNVTKNVDYTTIADRLRAVSWSIHSHPTSVVKPGLKGTNLPTHRKISVINRTWQERNIIYNTNGLLRKWIYILKSNQESNETFLYHLIILK